VRGTKREVISRCYNLLLRTTMAVSFSDAQCGFKAMRRDVADRLLPLIEDDRWFFDTELLILAERAGLRVHEVPVDWTDDPDSKVNILRTALDDLRGMVRVSAALARHRIPIEAVYRELGRGPLPGAVPPGPTAQLVRFAIVGGFSTLAYALLYLLALPLLGAQAGNFLALLITAIANTWANRWFTFGVTGGARLVRQHAQALAVFALAWGITAGSLAALNAATPSAGAAAQILVLTAANLAATVLRFALLRVWVFRPRRQADPGPVAALRPALRPREEVR
jgi:putative flippase GtrA